MRRSLGRLLPELGVEPDQGEEADARLRRSILSMLARGLAGMAAVTYDDLHFSDDASIELATTLPASAFPLGRPEGPPRLLVCSRRGQLAARHELALDRLLERGLAVRIEVAALGEAGVSALLDGLALPGGPELAARLARVTGSNPMFVLEAAQHVLDGAPDGSLLPRLEQLILECLERLSESALPLARAASVLQRDFSVEQVAELLGMPLLEAAAAWDELEGAQIMAGERFVHDLLAEAVLNGMPAVVHRAAARLLARREAAPARVAQQWLAGGDGNQAAPWLLKAGAAARLAFRCRETEQFYRQAAGLFRQQARPAQATDAELTRLDVLADLGRPQPPAGHSRPAGRRAERRPARPWACPAVPRPAACRGGAPPPRGGA